MSRRATAIRLFPVKSSLPAHRTIVSPAGKTQPLIIFATLAFDISAEAVFDAAPASAMKKPARKIFTN